MNTTAANLLNNIPSLKLSATDVLRVLHDGLYFDSNNNIHHANFVKQKKVLENIIDSIRTDPEAVVQELYHIRDALATPENAFFFLATNVKNLVQGYGSDLTVMKTLLNTTAESSLDVKERFPVKSEYFYRDTDRAAKPQHIAMGVGGTESCYLKQSVQYINTDWTNPIVSHQ